MMILGGDLKSVAWAGMVENNRTLQARRNVRYEVVQLSGQNLQGKFHYCRNPHCVPKKKEFELRLTHCKIPLHNCKLVAD